ncbi:alpha/beta hydrolase [Flammeovirga sp. SR4]|uniref:Alpha/beta hydrolase n=2 Tax=Flammeovirga agarivorans TaxID=2726742 RepID=A0A7X8SQJ1_9BACT|nr:alpha/beta hydrolase [Flammeovirga agarivorans]
MNALSSYLNETINSINILDKFYASFLMFCTKEYKGLKKQRALNKYSENPTLNNPSDIKTEYTVINTIKIRYAHYSNPGKETILLLSPLPQSIIAYAPIWNDLIKDYNVYAYDLPGFGRSEGGLEFMTFEAQGQFLHHFIEHFNIKKPHIVAPDVGMPTAIYYTAQHKKNVSSLIIGDGPAINPSNNGSIIEKLGFSKFWQFLIGNFVDAGAFVEVGNRLGYVNYTPNSFELSDYIKSYKGRLSNPIEWFKKYPESLTTLDPLLEKVSVPTLIFWGENDEILPKDNGIKLQNRINQSEIKIFKNCGHFSYQDQSEEFMTMIQHWLNQQLEGNNKND